MNVYRIEDYNGSVIYKEWNKMLGLADEEPSNLVVVCPDGDLGKHEMR